MYLQTSIKTLCVCMLLSLCLGVSQYANAASNAKQSVQAIENRVDIYETDMYTNIHVREINAALNKWCNAETIQGGEGFYQRFTQILQRDYAKLSDAAMLDQSYTLYERIQRIQEKKLDSYDGDIYCKVKYILYNIQNWLRDEHIAVMDRTGIIEDFNGFVNQEVEGFEVKIGTISNHISKYGSYRHKLGSSFSYEIVNPEFFNTLTDKQEVLLKKTEELMKAMLSYSFYELKKEGVLNRGDIDMIKDKVKLEYVNKCNLFHGKYEIRQTLDGAGNHISYDTLGLTLKVNLCPNYFVIKDMPNIFQKIITHELGHHVYYYKDHETSKQFTSICWSGETQQKAICDDNDFVTPYAQTMGVEDYAEHFMHWFLGKIENRTPIINQKTKHFENLF